MTTSNELAMFGCDIREFKNSVLDSFTFRLSGMPMVVISLMSDAQEQMNSGDTEGARQTLNKAKYLLSLEGEELLMG